jgi:hypothetical protein
MKGRLFVVTNCMNCPNCKVERTPQAGDALDYYCEAISKNTKHNMIAGYVEYESEGPQDGKFPKFCPLKLVSVKTAKKTEQG